MPANERGDDQTDKTPLDRRNYLKLVGGMATAAAGLGTVSQKASALTTINLGNKGLKEGDKIDSYLEQFWKSGNEVVIPSGTYKWSGGGLEIEGGDALLRAEGEAVLERQADVMNVDFHATSGTIEIRNLTIRGAAGEDGRLRSQADEGATVRLVNIRQPDGTAGDSEATAFYTPREHAGLVEYIDCEAQGWGNNGIYASSPGKEDGGQGKVRVIGGFFANNNIASVRLGSPGSEVRDVVVVNEKQAPARLESGRRQRGIRIRDQGNNIKVENCHVTHTYNDGGAGEPFIIHDGAVGGSTTVNKLLIHNDTDVRAIRQKDQSYDLSGSNVQLTGNGNLEYPESDLSQVCVGDQCTVAKTEELDGSGSTSTSDSTDSTSTDGSTSTSDSTNTTSTDGSTDGSTSTSDSTDSTSTSDSDSPRYPHTLTVEGDGYATLARYEFKVSGELKKGGEADDADTVSGSTASGTCGGTDTFRFSGEVVSFDLEGPGTVYVNDEPLNPENLGSDTSGEGESRVEIVSKNKDNEFDYEFTATGKVSRILDTGELSAEESNDDITKNSDGTYTVKGHTGHGYGDTYKFEDAEITDIKVTTTPKNFSVFVEGEEVTSFDRRCTAVANTETEG